MFEPGKSGNAGGRPKGSGRNILIKQMIDDGLVTEALRVMKTKLKSNNVDCAKFVLDQVYGKAAQSINHGSNEDSPVILKVEYVNRS